MKKEVSEVRTAGEIRRRFYDSPPRAGMYNPLMRISTPRDAARYLEIADSHEARKKLVEGGFCIPKIFEGHPVVGTHMVYAKDPKSGLYIARLFEPSGEPVSGELADVVDAYLFGANIFPRAAITTPGKLQELMTVLQPYIEAEILVVKVLEKQKGPGVLQHYGA